jgi:hypothetical protein
VTPAAGPDPGQTLTAASRIPQARPPAGLETGNELAGLVVRPELKPGAPASVAATRPPQPELKPGP